MTKNKFLLITGIIGGVVTIADCVLSYLNPPMTVQIVGAIDIVQTAIVEVLALFTMNEVAKLNK